LPAPTAAAQAGDHHHLRRGAPWAQLRLRLEPRTFEEPVMTFVGLGRGTGPGPPVGSW